MAKLVGVCRSEDCELQRRQFPLFMDDTLELIIQFPDMCTNCHSSDVDQKEVNSFSKKFRSLSTDDLKQATVLTKQFLIGQLSNNVQCVGCRRSIEKLLEELAKVSHRAMEPLSVSCTGSISIMQEYLSDPRSIYSVLYVQSSCFSVEINGRARKGKRCVLHSIDAHKSKALWSWQDVLELASSECQEEILLIDFDNLHNTLDDYLRKHRFCSDCKNKVTNAYRILVKEADGTNEKGFCPSLYEGIKVCDKEKHLHVSCDEKFIKSLIERAEPEIAGSQREQHAKTMDVAQEEVLTCLGIYLHDRFVRLLQKLKVEEKSWLILYGLGVEAFRKNIEAAFEKKLGRYNVDNIMNELVLEAEQTRTPVKQTRRRKKKCKKTEVENVSPSCDGEKTGTETFSTIAVKDDTKLTGCTDVGLGNQDSNHNIVRPAAYQCQCAADVCLRQAPSAAQADWRQTRGVGNMPSACGEAGANICDSCDSRGSTKASHERCCASTHGRCAVESPPSCSCRHLGISCVDCRPHPSSPSLVGPLNSRPENGHCGDVVIDGVDKELFSSERSFCNGFSRYATTLSLQEMLKTPRSSDDEDCCEIGEDEILQFKANEQRVTSERQRLRQTLRQRFATMQQRCVCPKTRDYAGSSSVNCNINIVSSKLAQISTD